MRKFVYTMIVLGAIAADANAQCGRSSVRVRVRERSGSVARVVTAPVRFVAHFLMKPLVGVTGVSISNSSVNFSVGACAPAPMVPQVVPAPMPPKK